MFSDNIFLKIINKIFSIIILIINYILCNYHHPRYVLLFHDDKVTGMDSVPAMFYCIFVVHTMLPATRTISVAIGVVTAIIDLAVVASLYEEKDVWWKVRQV